VSFIVERRLAAEVLDGTLPDSEGAAFDVMNGEGRMWEVRSITRNGIYFCPSWMVGSGRQFEVGGFLQKLEQIDGYVLADIELFPDIPFWTVPVSIVRDWWHSGRLGSASKVTRRKALDLLRKA